MLDLASSWKDHVPTGGFVMLASLTIGAGVTLFTTFEGTSQSEAVYASIIAGGWLAGWLDTTTMTILSCHHFSLLVVAAS